MMEPSASRVWQAVPEAVCPPNVGFCMGSLPATDEDVALVRDALRDTGSPDAIVRLARPETRRRRAQSSMR
jgi:hypothetical protein